MQRAPHQPLFAQAPLAQLSAAFAFGILVARYLYIQQAAVIFGGVLLSITALIALLKQRLLTSGVFLIAAVFMTGIIVQTHARQARVSYTLKTFLDGKTLRSDEFEVNGVVDGPVDFAVDRVFLTLNVERLRSGEKDVMLSGIVALSVLLPSPQSITDFHELQLRHGTKIHAKATLRRTDNYRNPGVLLLTEYLDRKGYDAIGLIKSPLLVNRLGDVGTFTPLALLYLWRQRLQEEINRLFSQPTAGVLNAALLGNRYSLSPAVAERFRTGGTFHVLVISGLHISFIASLVLLLMRRLTKRRGLQFAVSTLVLWGYTLAVGADASVVRAALMFTMVALGELVFRHSSSLNAVGATGLMLLLWAPRNLFDPSFQLTFLSVLAIVVIAWPTIQKIGAIGSWRPTNSTPFPPGCSRGLRAFAEVLIWSQRKWQLDSVRSPQRCRLFKSPVALMLDRLRVQLVLRYVFAAIVVSTSVQVVLLPFMVVYFHRVSFASLVLNILVGIFMAGLALVALAALLIAQFSQTIGALLINLATLLNWMMVHSVDPFAEIGWAGLRLPHYSGPASALYWIYYAPLIMLAFALSRWNPLALPRSNKKHIRRVTVVLFVIQLVALTMIITHPLSAGRPDGKLRIDFLDVGQGDSALVTFPDGATMLIDGGGQPRFSNVTPELDLKKETQLLQNGRSIGERVVSEYLWSRGLDTIDYVLVTHADADHIDGLNDVVQNFRVRAALAGRQPRDDPEFLNFVATLTRQNVPLHLIGGGDILRFDCVTADVLWPRYNDNPSAASRNNDSVTLKLVFGRRKVLLTGDVESRAEAAIVNDSKKLDADVVKVAHHGSRTSSIDDFVNATRPQVAIISVGQTSMFGHPNREVVERWKAIGANVLTTGNSGTITFTTDGNELIVTTYVPDRDSR